MSKSTSGLLPQVSFSVLFALSLKPRHGYELLQQIGQDSGGKVRLGPGSLYGTIKRLTADGLVEEMPFEADSDRRRYYRLTRKGWNALESELAYYETITQLAWQRRLSLNKDFAKKYPETP